MDFYEVIKNRKTIRNFSSRLVEEEKVRKILEAGINAPTHNHMREWEYILLKDRSIRLAIVESAEKLPDKLVKREIEESLQSQTLFVKEMYLTAIPFQKRMILTAPEVLVMCYKIPKPIKNCLNIYELNSLASVWCCIENILLGMAAEGIYGVTYIPKHTNRIRDILNIPDNYEIPAIIPMGYPGENATRCRQNEISLDAKIHINAW